MKRTPLKRRTPLKAYTQLKAKTKLKPYSKKRAKVERERKSMFTTDLKTCIECNYNQGKIDIHEIFEGKNRLKSMKYELVIPLCRPCHQNKEIIEKWYKKGRQAFIKKYSEELFTREFQTRKGLE